MVVQIEFIKGQKEITSPIVKLTKSINGKTGTATFIFLKPTIFNNFSNSSFHIDGVYLKWDNKEIVTKDVVLFFKEGKPFFIKTIFIFKNSTEWFDFLNFMNLYSKEKGLLFESENF
jgi:photosystem II protein